MTTIENKLADRFRIVHFDKNSGSKIALKKGMFIKKAKIECGKCGKVYSKNLQGFSKLDKFFGIHDSSFREENLICPECNYKESIVYCNNYLFDSRLLVS